MLIKTIFVLFAYLFEVFLLGQNFSLSGRFLVAAWQKNLAKRWQQCRIHGFGWRYGGIENGQCNGSSTVRGRASVRVKASLPVISPLENVGTFLLSSLQSSTVSDGIIVRKKASRLSSD
jgi:hypothetical protein